MIIEAKLAGNEFLFEPAPELATAAESIVQRLRSRELEKPTDESPDGDTAHIKLDSVEIDNARSAGFEPKFSSSCVVAANFSRCFHAISTR